MVGGGSWFGLGFGLGRCRLGCPRCVCGIGGCVGRCWWWCCCWWCDPLGAGLGLGSGFGLGSRSRLRKTSVRRCEGSGAGWQRFPMCCRGAWVACVGVRGPPVAWRAAATLALTVVLWMRSAGRGGSEDEDEDEEEVVVLGDAGCAVMRAVVGLWAAASAAATAGRTEGMSFGLQVGDGWLGRPGRDLAARRADLVSSGGAGRRGAAVFAFRAWLGRGPAMCEVVWVGVRGGNSSRWLHSGAGGLGLGFLGCVRGACAGQWAGWACRGAWGSPRCVCAGCWMWGVVRGVRRLGPWWACAVVWAGGGGPCRGARGCARWWACVGRQVGSGEGGAWAGIARGGCCVGVCVRLQRRACVVRCRLGGWKRSLPSSAAAARISQTSMRIWCTSWSVVGKENASCGLRPTRQG